MGSSQRRTRAFPLAAAVLCLLQAPVAAITITEIHYNPGAGADDLEFVEVYNDSPSPFDLSGCYFAQGIDFTFPEETFLRAREAIVVCANRQAFVRAHPDVTSVLGDFSGRLDNAGETIALVTASGSPLAEVTYNDRGGWPMAVNGTGYTLSLRSPFAPLDDPSSWIRSGAAGGSPGTESFPPPAILDRPLFPEDSEWRYRKSWNEATQTPEDFSTPAGAWRQPGFDDSAWPQGPAPIGFGETEIATILDDMDGKYISFALRRTFEITPVQLEEMVGLTLTVRIDDGCAVHVNGTEIGRVNVPGAAGTEVPFDAAASGTREIRPPTKPWVFTIPKEQVRAGTNLLAVQVHNRTLTGTSSDAGFAGALAYQTRVVYPDPPEPRLLFNEIISRAPPAERGVEVTNVLTSALDTSGMRIGVVGDAARSYAFPAGTIVPPGGLAFVPESSLGFSLATPGLLLVLTAADGKEPLDAFPVEDPAVLPPAPQSHARYPDGRGGWWISAEPTPGTANQIVVERDVVINEIHFNPKLAVATDNWAPDPSPQRGEYVELFNRSGRTIDLTGYRFTSGFNFDLPADTSLLPGSFLVIARSPKFIRETHGLPAAQVLGPAEAASPEELDRFGTLRDGGERIRLVDPLGNTVDEVRYEEDGEWEELADGGGSSLELIDPLQDNASPHAWTASFEAAAAPWTEISFQGTYSASLLPQPMESELHIFLISEGICLLDGISVTQGDPAVETIPNGDFETDTLPWRLIGTHVRSQRTTDEARVGAACLRLVATGSGDNRVNRIELDTRPALKAGPLQLKMWARWVGGSNALHLSGHNNAFGRTVYLPLPAATGTPGRENSARVRLRGQTGSDNLGPVISQVRHSPAVPASLAPVHVQATVADADGIDLVEVLHQRDGDTAFARVQLFDDGEHQDGLAGDGIHANEIPGYAAKSLVNFHIEAKDRGGRIRTYPKEAPERLLTFIADDPLQSTLFRYRLVINSKNMNATTTGLARRLLHSDELVRGTFVFEESEVYYDVGCRYRGSPWNRPPDPKMFRIRFNGDKPFLDGVKRINISRYGGLQSEGLSYQLLYKASVADAPVPYSPRYHYLEMKVNDRKHGGILQEIRPIDSAYADFNFPADPDGFAHKITGKLAFTDGGTMAGGGPDWTQFRIYSNGPEPGQMTKENVRFYFNPATRTDDDNFETVMELLRAMDRSTTPDAEYDRRIAEVMNVESSLRVFAVRSLLADWDTIEIGNGQNAYLYHAPLEGRTYLVPWDMDHTFERTDVAIAPGAGTSGFRRLISRPLYKRLYARILNELSQSSWSQAYTSRWTTLVSENKATPGTQQVSFLNGRRTMVNTYIRTGLNVPFKITTPEPAAAAGGTATIKGTAGVEVNYLFVAVNQGEAELVDAAWATPQGQASAIPTLWTVQASGLPPGKGSIEVLAFGSAGDLLGAARIEVLDTTGWAAPAITAVHPATGPVQGGTALTIQGTGYQPGAQVAIGGRPAVNVRWISSGELAAESPAAAAAAAADVVVANIDGQSAMLPAGFAYGALQFQRGELDGTPGVNVTDAVKLLSYLFRGDALPCTDAADVDDSGLVNITDAIVLLRFLFQGGGTPPPPFEAPGADPTPDALTCD